jgi:protocatechuate 3,4-dioxygenase beta subunit
MRVVAAILVVGAIASLGAARPSAQRGSPPEPVAGGIHGRVLDAATHTPLKNARVQATSADGVAVRTVLTDSEGRFAHPSLPPGSYRITAAKSGYVTRALRSRDFRDPGTPVQVHPDADSQELELRLPKAAAISGRIVDERSDPVIGMKVSAEMVTSDANGVESAFTAASADLDDLGEYRLFGLPEGRFAVKVVVSQAVLGPGGTPFPPANVTLTVDAVGGRISLPGTTVRSFYYPGVPTAAESQTITLSPGDERASIDFNVPAMPPRSWMSLPGNRRVDWRQGTGTIRGRITGDDGRAVPSVPVRLVGDYPGVPPSTVTDADGAYEFSGLPSTTARVVAERSGFLNAEYGQRRFSEPGEPIVVRLGESRERIDITLRKPGAIDGRVFNHDGEPLEDATVHVFQARFESGRSRLVDAGGLGTHRTDDRGRYRIYGLKPGAYIVRASIGQMSLSRALADVPGYASTYFPGTPNPGDARWVAVDVAENVTGIDVALSPVLTARVSGIRLTEAGRPAGGTITLTPSRRSGSIAPTPVGARTQADGRFEFPNVSPGEYVLQASIARPTPFDEGEFASMFVTVNGTDMTGLVLRTSTGSTIKGHVTAEGNTEEWLWSDLTVSAEPVDFDLSPAGMNPPSSAGVRYDWSFELTGLSGPRLLRLRNPPPGWALKAVLFNGLDVTDRPLPFGTKDQSIANVEIVLTDQITELSGAVTDARGRVVSDCPVVVFAPERERWTVGSRFVTMTRAGRDGKFSVQRLPPGDYLVAAVDRMIEGEWQDPALLESLFRSASPVTLSEGQKLTLPIKLMVR